MKIASLILSGVALLFATFRALSADCVLPPAGLVAWWPGDGNAGDIGGSNDGVLEGSVAFVTGAVGQAFSFNGTNADMRIPASPSLNLGLVDGFTIETWINPADITEPHPIVEWNDGSFGVCFWASRCAGGALGSLAIDVKDTSMRDHCFNTAEGLLVSNIWQHVAATYVRSNGYTVLYINGVPMAEATLGAFIPRTIGDLYVGLRPYDGGAGSRFAGSIDELSLYNRALSAGEISGIYSASSAGKCAVAFITSQPQDETAVVGSTVTFVVSAGGAPPLSYQWQFNGTNTAGATASSLTLTNVQPDQAGSYLVIVSNALGVATSSNAVLAVIPPPPCVTPAAGLVAWWPGDGNAYDVAGANGGTLSGGATFASGKVGQAFSFDGVNGTVVVPDSSSLRLTSEFTLEAWINSRRPNGDQPILSKLSYATGNNGYEFVFYNGGLLGLLNSPGQPWPSASVAYGGPMPANVWHHVAFTYDQSAMMLYLNGSPVATNIIGPTVIASSASTLRIGSVEGNVIYFDGLIDEPAVYNRALSASEIGAIYSARSSGKCMSPVVTAQPHSQVGYWGKSVTFAATAIGTAPLSYQWHRDGVPITGATEASLVFTNLQMADAGAYTVVVTSPYGVTTSAPAYLTMNPAGVSLALYAGITIDGVPGLTYGVQQTTDLSDTNSWKGAANVTLSVPTMLWFDVYPATQPQRYYRVVPGPISIP